MLQNRPVSELTPRMRQLFERARAAFKEGRRSYAVELLRAILKQEPGCAGVRRVLHAVHREMHASDGVAGRAMAAVKSVLPLYLRVPRLFRDEQHAELLELLEDLLGKGAPARPVLTWLARLAETCHIPETGTVALESLVNCRPNDVAAWRAYIAHCRQHDLHKRAIQGLQRLSVLRPGDVEIRSELRQAAAADTVAEARWDQVASYREVLRDEEKAQKLEEERRPAASLGEDATKSSLAAAKTAVEDRPTAENRRRLADLLRREGDLDGALAQYESVAAAAQHVDATLDEAMVGCLKERTEQDVRKWREYARNNPENAEMAAMRIETLESERATSLLAHYEERAKRFPLETRYQADLGPLYLAAGRLDEALRCYQAARRNPALHFGAGVGVGRCLAAKGLYDLAEREFLECLELAPPRSRDRLVVMYELAALCEAAGRNEDAFGQLKEIYAQDATYRDVGERIDGYIRQRDAGREEYRVPAEENAS